MARCRRVVFGLHRGITSPPMTHFECKFKTRFQTLRHIPHPSLPPPIQQEIVFNAVEPWEGILKTHVGNREATSTFIEDRAVADRLDEIYAAAKLEATSPLFKFCDFSNKQPFKIEIMVCIRLLSHYITMHHHLDFHFRQGLAQKTTATKPRPTPNTPSMSMQLTRYPRERTIPSP